MFSIPNASQTTFIYGPTVYKNLIPENTILYKINQVIDFSFLKALGQNYPAFPNISISWVENLILLRKYNL